MTVVINTNLVINIAMIRKANLVLSIAMVKIAKLSLSLSLLMVSWVLQCSDAYEYHQLLSLSLPTDGFMGLAVPQCLWISPALLLSLSSWWFYRSCGAAMLMNITSFSPLSLFLLMVLWVLRCRNAYENNQLFSSLSLPDGFMGLAVLQCLWISPAFLLSLSSSWWVYGSCGAAMLMNITSSSLLSLFLLMVL